MTQAKHKPVTWEELKALGPTKLSRIFGCPVTTAHAWIKRGGPPKWLPKILVAYANGQETHADTLKYWRDISECECSGQLPQGGCLRCDLDKILPDEDKKETP